jgi:hypothetical protein
VLNATIAGSSAHAIALVGRGRAGAWALAARRAGRRRRDADAVDLGGFDFDQVRETTMALLPGLIWRRARPGVARSTGRTAIWHAAGAAASWVVRACHDAGHAATGDA